MSPRVLAIYNQKGAPESPSAPPTSRGLCRAGRSRACAGDIELDKQANRSLMLGVNPGSTTRAFEGTPLRDCVVCVDEAWIGASAPIASDGQPMLSPLDVGSADAARALD
jgi:hypothetical protein